MSDLLERLRALDLLRAGDKSPSWADIGALGNEAASEIERLRATIAQLRAVVGAVSVEGHSYADIKSSMKQIGGMRVGLTEDGKPLIEGYGPKS